MAGGIMTDRFNLEISGISLDIPWKVSSNHPFTRLANRSLRIFISTLREPHPHQHISLHLIPTHPTPRIDRLRAERNLFAMVGKNESG